MRDELSEISLTLTRLNAIDGEDAKTKAREWLAAGFDDAEEIAEWVAAGCFAPLCARLLDEAGITPEQAALRTRAGSGDYEETIGRKFANGDLTSEEARRIVTKEFWDN